jgi:PmbA protein
VTILNSRDVYQSFERGIASCEVRAVAEEKGLSETGWDYNFSPRFDDLQVVGTAHKATSKALGLLGAKPLVSGKYQVIFEARAASYLIQLLAPSFFATNVQRKKSALIAKKGKQEYNKLVTVIDDGIMPDGYQSFPFDDEGLPRRKNYLIKEGAVVDWLYDAARAKKDERQSSGNSSRYTIHSPPVVDVTNCYLCPGEKKLEDLYSQAGKAFLVTDVMGLHTANVITGDFSLGAEGFEIQSGKLGRPVRSVIVAGNVHDLFKRVTGLADDLHFYGNYGAPSILVPDVQVSGG